MRKVFTKNFYILFVSFFVAGNICAQEKALVVRGHVTDKIDNSPMVGVSVAEVDKEDRILNGVLTDLNGDYALKVSNPNNTISFSFIGFFTVKEPINGRSFVNMPITPEVKELQTVEIIAKKPVNNGLMDVDARDITSAVAKIDAKDLAELQATSIDQALQGRLPGVDIVANSGDPGAGMSIRIRGTSSLNQSSNPLIVVDGMPYDITVSSDFNFATATEQGYAQLLNIAPSDIKDITVLKDAAATAIWGSRASNGVLIINTKRGAKGKPSLTYTFKGTLTKQPNAVPMLSGDQYSMLIPEEFMNSKGTPLNTTLVKEFQYDPNDPYYYYNYSNNTNWIKEITQIGYLQDHNISLVGGGEKATYFTSLGYNQQIGTTIGTDLRRINARINLDFKVSSKIKFRSDFSYTHVDNNQNYTDQIRSIAYRKMPNMSVYEHDEFGNITPNFFSPASNIQGYYGASGNANTFNPVAMARSAKNRTIGDRIRPVFDLQYQILPSLTATANITFDINSNKTNRFLPQVATGLASTNVNVNRADNDDQDKFIVQSKTSLIYSPTFQSENHKLQMLLSYMTYDEKNIAFGVTTANSASSSFQSPTDPARIQNSDLRLASGISQNRNFGLVLNAQYGYLDRYIINVGIREDGNSKFGERYRYGYFPSVSGRWRVSGESFMENISSINDLSFRASMGASGNAPSNSYSHFGRYTNFTWNYMGQAGLYPVGMELDNLRWETVVQQNVGLSAALFKNMVSLDFDVYRKRTNNLFFPGLAISSISGFDNVDMNVGTMDNQGFEVNLNTTVLKKNDLTVTFNLNFAKNLNIIRKISENYPRTSGNVNKNGEYLLYMQENNPFGSFYGYRYKGVYRDAESTSAHDGEGNPITDPNGNPIYMRFGYPQTNYIFQPGDAIYEDINHDGNINYQDVVYIGNANPKLTGGFGPSIIYKNFKLNVFFNFRYGYQIINQTKMNTTNMYTYDNQSTAVLRRWRSSGDVTDIPRAMYQTGYNWLGSDRYVEDGSFIRIKYITLRYDVNNKILSKLKIGSIGVYTTVENLITFTNYTGQDPEVSYKGNSPFQIGYDTSLTPPSRTITLGLSARF